LGPDFAGLGRSRTNSRRQRRGAAGISSNSRGILALGVEGTMKADGLGSVVMRGKRTFRPPGTPSRRAVGLLATSVVAHARPAKLVRTEKRDGYVLERLILDLNGSSPCPPCPDPRPPARARPRPAVHHWHGACTARQGAASVGVDVQPAYAPSCAEKGIVALAIDSWCFGERKRAANGRSVSRTHSN